MSRGVGEAAVGPRRGAVRWRALPLAVLAAVLAAPAPGARGADPLRRLQYALDRVQAERAWVRARGAGVAIAILDTGVDLLHEDLRSRLIPGRDFVDGDDVPQDQNGHGTHVAGIAAAATGNGVGIDGVAPDAWIMPLRVLDREGTGLESNVAAAIDWAVLHATGLGLRLVINMSFTDLDVAGAAASRRIQDAVRRAWFAGAVVVAAVGNESLPSSNYPAAGPNILAVGATDERGRRAPYSNRGPLVVAPGTRIVSTYFRPDTPGDHGLYATGSGTSMAAPIVSGVAALLLSSGLTNQQAVERIVQTAEDLGPPGRDDEYGYGMVNAARALGVEADSSRPAAPVVPAQAPLAAGKFEPIDPSRPAVQAEGASARRGPGKAGPGAAAAVLVCLAYAAARVGAGVRAERQGSRPWPWEG